MTTSGPFEKEPKLETFANCLHVFRNTSLVEIRRLAAKGMVSKASTVHEASVMLAELLDNEWIYGQVLKSAEKKFLSMLTAASKKVGSYTEIFNLLHESACPHDLLGNRSEDARRKYFRIAGQVRKGLIQRLIPLSDDLKQAVEAWRFPDFNSAEEVQAAQRIFHFCKSLGDLRKVFNNTIVSSPSQEELVLVEYLRRLRAEKRVQKKKK
jgi:hypothetical protein